MNAAGFSWGELTNMASTVIGLLEKDGPLAADAARQILKAIQFLSGGSFDLAGIIQALSQTELDVKQIIVDVKAAFNLS